MRVESHPEKLLEGIAVAFADAVQDTLEEARRIASRSSRTGKFAASLEATDVALTSNGYEAAIGSPLASARAKEKGAFIQAKRAPYLVIPQPDGSVRKVKAVRLPPRPAVVPAGRRFPEFMTARLKAGFR